VADLAVVEQVHLPLAVMVVQVVAVVATLKALLELLLVQEMKAVIPQVKVIVVPLEHQDLAVVVADLVAPQLGQKIMLVVSELLTQ
jgi:hypothetical protein